MVFTGMGGNELEVRITGDADDAVTAIDDVINGLGRLRTLAGLAGAAMAGLGAVGFAAATKAAADFEEAMVEVEKVTNPETARAMTSRIREMAETIPLAQTELATLAADAARFGVRGTENIEAFTESVARMAIATDLSAQQAGEAFARLATLTETPVTEIENLGSAINTLSNNFATSSQEIVDAMLRASGALTSLGLGATEIAGLSAAINEVSESSERAGTRLRRLAQELLEPRKQQQVASALGVTADEFERMLSDDPTGVIVSLAEAMGEGGQRADALNEALSTTSRTAVAALANNLEGTRAALEQSSEAFEEGTSLTTEFDAAVDTFNSRLQLTRNRLNNIAITTGEATLPALTDLLGVVNRGIEGFADLNERTDGLAGQLTLLGLVAGGTAAAIWAFAPIAGTPVGAAILGAGALAIAWNQNLGDIASTTTWATNDIMASFNRMFSALNTETGAFVGEQASMWQRLHAFMVAFGQGIDTVALGITTTVDGITTTVATAVEVLGELARAAELIEQGRRGEARAALERAAATPGERSAAMRERTIARGTAGRQRLQERQRLLDQIRAGTVGGGSDAIEKALQESREQQRVDATRRDQLLSQIQSQTTPSTQSTAVARGFEDADRCSRLLDAFERAPRPASSGAGGAGSSGPYAASEAADTAAVRALKREMAGMKMEVDGKTLGEVVREQNNKHTDSRVISK